MPKNTVTDPITDQEMAFAHLILSGTMNDRRAAEAVGLNPETAAYTKSKPRVRAYMMEHRAAVREKLVDQEADGLRKLNLGRDQILGRLWELANLSHEVTRGIAHYPSHHHAAIEELFLLSGDLHLEGQVMRAGDYCRADRGSIHGETFTDDGCLFLLMASPENQIAENRVI